MQTLKVIVVSLLLAASTMAQTGSQAPPQQQQTPPGPEGSTAAKAQIDPKKEADIRRLLEATGGKATMSNVMAAMQTNLKTLLSSTLPAGDYRAKLIDLFFDEFQARANREFPQLLEAAIPVYDKYFSDEEILGLIHFYESELGQKAVSVTPKVSAEMQATGMKLGQRIGRESMVAVLEQHPELKKALEDAQKSPRPQ